MGLLDALLSNDSGGGLLGGLPPSWQWHNPAGGVGNPDTTPDPFGSAPQLSPPQSALQRVGTAGLVGGGPSGPIPGLLARPVQDALLSPRPPSIPADLTGADVPRMAQHDLNAQFRTVRQALLQDGVSPQEAASKAMLAVLNRQAGKLLLAEALDAKPMVAGGESPTLQPGGGLPAAGVGQADSALQGQYYIKRFFPAVPAAVQDYIDGKPLPVGNAEKRFDETVRRIAQKVGRDIGLPVNETTQAVRRQMHDQLDSSEPGSAGAQINTGNAAAGDLVQPAVAGEIARKAIEETPAQRSAEFAAGLHGGVGATAAADIFRAMADARAALAAKSRPPDRRPKGSGTPG